jgi:hypothetical protein
MTGSPFSNVLGHDPDSSTFVPVETDQRSDTTSETDARPADTPTESSVPVEVATDGSTHEAEQNEAAGDAVS